MIKRLDTWDTYAGQMDTAPEQQNLNVVCPYAIAVEHDREEATRRTGHSKRTFTFNLNSPDTPCTFCDGTLEYRSAIGCTKAPEEYLRARLAKNLKDIQSQEDFN